VSEPSSAPGPEEARPPVASERGAARAQGETNAAREEYGPLAVARHHKDDGRELILYTWRGEP
jgi:hypothetical protein